jgi:hypothetical protein
MGRIAQREVCTINKSLQLKEGFRKTDPDNQVSFSCKDNFGF